MSIKYFTNGIVANEVVLLLLPNITTVLNTLLVKPNWVSVILPDCL